MKFLESLGKNARTIIAMMVMILSYGFLYLVSLRKIPDGNRDLVMLASGIVLGVVTTVAAYYFGASKDKSDKDKADIIEQHAAAGVKNEGKITST